MSAAGEFIRTYLTPIEPQQEGISSYSAVKIINNGPKKAWQWARDRHKQESPVTCPTPDEDEDSLQHLSENPKPIMRNNQQQILIDAFCTQLSPSVFPH